MTFLSWTGPNDPHLAYLTFFILLWPPQTPLSLFHVVCLAQGLACPPHSLYHRITSPFPPTYTHSSVGPTKGSLSLQVHTTSQPCLTRYVKLDYLSILPLCSLLTIRGYVSQSVSSVAQSCPTLLRPHESQHILGYVGLPYAAVMLMSPRQRAGQESLLRKLERENQNMHVIVPILLYPF